MNKLVKGAVAGAAGIALLLGGAGTFALWNSSIGVGSSTVSTGTLKFGTATGATWRDDSAGATTTAFVPTTDKIVPGDVVSLTQNVTVSASGKNLKASLVYVPGSVTIPADLTGKIVPTLTVTWVSGDSSLTGTGTVTDPYIITPPANATGTSVFKVKISYAFDSAVTGTVGQGESVDLSGATYLLTQIHS